MRPKNLLISKGLCPVCASPNSQGWGPKYPAVDVRWQSVGWALPASLTQTAGEGAQVPQEAFAPTAHPGPRLVRCPSGCCCPFFAAAASVRVLLPAGGQSASCSTYLAFCAGRGHTTGQLAHRPSGPTWSTWPCATLPVSMALPSWLAMAPHQSAAAFGWYCCRGQLVSGSAISMGHPLPITTHMTCLWHCLGAADSVWCYPVCSPRLIATGLGCLTLDG